MYTVSDLGKLLILSPRLDDAVFSCGELIARKPGTILVALFAGAPSGNAGNAKTAGKQATSIIASQDEADRRQEEQRAAEVLGAVPVWLDFADSSHASSPSIVGVAEALTDVLEQYQPNTVMLPAGLSQADHILAHQAALLARTQFPETDWMCYEDALYRRLPSLLQDRLSNLAHFGIYATPLAFNEAKPTDRELKHKAVQCLQNRLQSLQAGAQQDQDDIFAPEGYWQLSTATLTC